MSYSAQKFKNIHIRLENPTLERLVAEQLSALKGTSCDPNLDPDCLVTDERNRQGSPFPTVPVLELGKGQIILGNILDQLKYLLSGRESHVEDENETMDLGDFLLHPAQNTLVHKESQELIHLTDKERLLLRTLSHAGGSGLTKTDLLRSIWGYAEAAETHTLETHIYRLRQKLEPFQGQDLIRSMDGCYVLDTIKR